MTRVEHRLTLTPADQAYAHELATSIGWSTAGLVGWLLIAASEGLDVDDALQMTAIAHWARRQPGWDPTLRKDTDGRAYTEVAVPNETGRPEGPMLLPPVPGINEWTLIHWADPAGRDVVEVTWVDVDDLRGTPPSG